MHIRIRDGRGFAHFEGFSAAAAPELPQVGAQVCTHTRGAALYCPSWQRRGSVLWDSLAQLPPAQLAARAGLAFDSIHGTLVHLLCADILWYQRLTKTSCTLGFEGKDISKLWSLPATGVCIAGAALVRKSSAVLPACLPACQLTCLSVSVLLWFQ